MIAGADDQHNPVAAGLFGAQHELSPCSAPISGQAQACPLETARAFAQLFATSQTNEPPAGRANPGPCLA